MSVYERFTFRGETLDRMTIAALLAAEKFLGYDNHILQGSYSSSVPQSAGTHDGGGALDLVWRPRIRRQTKMMRKHGRFAYWPRRALIGHWNRHGHGILIGNERASSGAKEQIVAYRNGRDGLASNGPDTWWRPKVIRAFDYDQAGLVSWERLNRIRKTRTKTALTREGRRQVETIARALRGFNMNLGGHRKGRMDDPLVHAIRRFSEIRDLGPVEVDGPVGPKLCYALCVPIRDND